MEPILTDKLFTQFLNNKMDKFLNPSEPKIICFNGAPGSGKDTAVDYIHSHASTNEALWFKRKFRSNLDEVCTRILIHLGVVETLQEANAILLDETNKDLMHPELKMTPRQFKIKVSEHIIKPVYGKDAFGKSFVKDIREFEGDLFKDRALDNYPIMPRIYLVSDAGFQEEANCLLELFKPENIYIVNIEREGHTFKNDSRGYIEHPKEKFKLTNTVRVTNEDLKTFQNKVLTISELVASNKWEGLKSVQPR